MGPGFLASNGDLPAVSECRCAPGKQRGLNSRLNLQDCNGGPFLAGCRLSGYTGLRRTTFNQMHECRRGVGLRDPEVSDLESKRSGVIVESIISMALGKGTGVVLNEGCLKKKLPKLYASWGLSQR